MTAVRAILLALGAIVCFLLLGATHHAPTQFEVDMAYSAGRTRGYQDAMDKLTGPPDTLIFNLGRIGAQRDSMNWLYVSSRTYVYLRWEAAK